MYLSEIVDEVSLELRLLRDTNIDILGMATSKYENEKVFSFLEDMKYYKNILKNKNIVAIITTEEILNSIEIDSKIGVVISPNPKIDFFKIHNYLSEKEFYWTKFDNSIAKSSIIHNSSVLYDHSIIIGERCIIEPNVTIFPGVILGNDVIIRSGTQIGTNGFQYLKTDIVVLSVKSSGMTIIKDRVEIRHNCCIDRGVFGGNTVIEEDVKIDNFVHIPHDNFVGKRTLITAGVNLGGRVTIEEDSWIGLNATISNGITIGNNSKISLGSVVTKNVEPYSIVTGNFAIDHNKFIEFIKTIR